MHTGPAGSLAASVPEQNFRHRERVRTAAYQGWAGTCADDAGRWEDAGMLLV